GEALQRRAWPFWQQPDGNGWHGAPLFVALLAETPGLSFVGRLDWHPMPAVRTRGHSVNRPYRHCSTHPDTSTLPSERRVRVPLRSRVVQTMSESTLAKRIPLLG